MPVSNLVSLRSFPESLRPRLLVAYAAAREALISTHQHQLVRFTREFSRRMPALDALELYFRVVPVPPQMEDAVQSRALVALDLERLPDPPEPGEIAGALRHLRLDLVIEAWRQRRQALEASLQLARLAGARAAEAVLDTHVDNAVRIATLLEETVWVDEAVSHYIHTFRLPLATAHMVYQRARARVADRHLGTMLEPTATPAQAPPPVSAERTKTLRIPEQQVRIAG